MTLKNFMYTLASGILGFTLGLSGKIIYESTSVHAYQWPSAPIIVNCYGPEFPEAAMIKAIDYWTVRGYSIGFYEHSPPPSVCKSEWIYGMIVIRKASFWKLAPETLAQTRRYTSLDVLKGAVIEYRPGSYNLDLLNEHELGHALGMTHVEKVGHIMHPIYEKMGDVFDLEKE